jgi:dTDP-4-amino-4,6-dideoxygalactose transaminase
MIPRFKPALCFDELKACLSLPGKDDVKLFENAFADLMGQKHALAFPYGRTGLMLLLKALGLNNKEIICPAYTCVVVPHAIVYSNNIPVFVDCEPDGFNMDLDQVEKKITPRTGAVIATSIFGYPVDLGKLDKIRSRQPHVHIIQDCAHSFSAEWKGRPVQKEGVAALFGLNISKILTSIFGGMITTDYGRLYRRLKEHRDRSLRPAGRKKSLCRIIYFAAVYPAFWKHLYGIVNHLENSSMLNSFTRYFDEKKIDMPSDYQIQMSGVEAKVGIVQIEKYHDIIQTRRQYSAYYSSALKNIEGINIVKAVEGANYSHIIVLSKNREILLKKALERGLQLGSIIDYCIPNMPAYKKYTPPDEEYPIANYYSEHIINLPVSGEFNIEAAHDVVEILRQICLEAENREGKYSIQD